LQITFFNLVVLGVKNVVGNSGVVASDTRLPTDIPIGESVSLKNAQ
jgi:hypothetical protein